MPSPYSHKHQAKTMNPKTLVSIDCIFSTDRLMFTTTIKPLDRLRVSFNSPPVGIPAMSAFIAWEAVACLVYKSITRSYGSLMHVINLLHHYVGNGLDVVNILSIST